MTAVLAYCRPLITIPARYAISSAAWSALARAAWKLESLSRLPMISFSVTNSSALIAPDSSALRPYWRPVLSRVSRARVSLGSAETSLDVVPKIDAAQFQAWQRAPLGLVNGWYTMPHGSWQLLVETV